MAALVEVEVMAPAMGVAAEVVMAKVVEARARVVVEVVDSAVARVTESAAVEPTAAVARAGKFLPGRSTKHRIFCDGL